MRCTNYRVGFAPNKKPFQAQLIQKLIKGGVDVHVATRQTALMHNKVSILDGQTVCTSSFSCTNQAEKLNDENLVVLDGASVAAAYEKNVFQRILKNETVDSPALPVPSQQHGMWRRW